MWSGLTKRSYMLPKNGPFFGPLMLHTQNIFVMVLTEILKSVVVH